MSAPQADCETVGEDSREPPERLIGAKSSGLAASRLEGKPTTTGPVMTLRRVDARICPRPASTPRAIGQQVDPLPKAFRPARPELASARPARAINIIDNSSSSPERTRSSELAPGRPGTANAKSETIIQVQVLASSAASERTSCFRALARANTPKVVQPKRLQLTTGR